MSDPEVFHSGENLSIISACERGPKFSQLGQAEVGHGNELLQETESSQDPDKPKLTSKLALLRAGRLDRMTSSSSFLSKVFCDYLTF